MAENLQTETDGVVNYVLIVPKRTLFIVTATFLVVIAWFLFESGLKYPPLEPDNGTPG